MFKLNNGKECFNVFEKDVKTRINVLKKINNQDVKFFGLSLNADNQIVLFPEWYLKPNEKINLYRNNKIWNLIVSDSIKNYEVFSFEKNLLKKLGSISYDQLKKVLLKKENEINTIEPIKKQM